MTYIPEKCPDCGAEELRPQYLGNNRDGWQLTGDFECDACGAIFTPSVKDEYTDYKDQEIAELNAR